MISRKGHKYPTLNHRNGVYDMGIPGIVAREAPATCWFYAQPSTGQSH